MPHPTPSSTHWIWPSWQWLMLMLLPFILVACSSSPRHEHLDHSGRHEVQRVAFDTGQLRRGQGVAHVVGRAFIRDHATYGERASSAIDVILNPVSEASRQWYDEVCRRGNVLVGPIDRQYQSYVRTTRTNTFGQFVFENVPQGEYYLSARMYWLDKTPYSGPVQYGGLVAKKVNLAQGLEVIDLSDDDRCNAYYH